MMIFLDGMRVNGRAAMSRMGPIASRSWRCAMSSSSSLLSSSSSSSPACTTKRADVDYAYTKEQLSILMHTPKEEEVVAVNALAGCGKTSTIALLCHKIQSVSILYLVFNKEMAKEAGKSGKFPRNTDIRTTHSYVFCQLFSANKMKNFKPTSDYNLDKIIETLDLTCYCKSLPSKLPKRQLKQEVKTIARYILKTVHKFQWSADKEITKDHVFCGTKKDKDTELRKHIEPSQYIYWATVFFDKVREKCANLSNGRPDPSDVDISHDGYLKVAQLEELKIPHDYIIIDEAQDMNACQADLFWGQWQRAGKIIYLFGDKFQQLYRFRGASHSFRVTADTSNPKFTLTGAFRFGKNIASCATTVLRALGGDTLHGHSKKEGKVVEGQALDCGVVLCRTNYGIFQYLSANRPVQWCYLSRTTKPPSEPNHWELELESFMTGKASKFTFAGESFSTTGKIQEFIAAGGSMVLSNSFNLLKFCLVPRRKSIAQFYSDLYKSFAPMGIKQSPDDYRGIIVTTVHKAKGLEFNCPVLVYDDFNFDEIRLAAIKKDTHAVNKALHCEEGNLFYVAMTRAKNHLYLSPKANECLNSLKVWTSSKVLSKI